MSDKYSWTTSDEINFINDMPNICKEKDIDLFLCISNYLNCIDHRRWDSRFIDINKIKNAAKCIQEYSIEIQSMGQCNYSI